jgi:hypothetical protein
MKVVQKEKKLQHTWIPTSTKSVRRCAKCSVFKKSFYTDAKNIVTGYCWSLGDDAPFATTFDCKP